MGRRSGRLRGPLHRSWRCTKRPRECATVRCLRLIAKSRGNLRDLAQCQPEGASARAKRASQRGERRELRRPNMP